MVLEEQNIVDIEESNGESDDDDFEKKINENKRLIKMHKLRKETEEQNTQINPHQYEKKISIPRKNKPPQTKTQKFRGRN